MKSKLATNADTQSIITWLQAAFRTKALTFTRCYSMKESAIHHSYRLGKSDKGTASGFHTACDGKGPTVTVVKTTGGAVFGGFADKAWSSPSSTIYQKSTTAFLFCLTCGGATAKPKGAHQLKLTGNRDEGALIHDKTNGPTFGTGYDLMISSQPGSPTRNSHSSSNLGESYAGECGAHGSTACQHYLAGSSTFTVEDYEVFVVSTA